MVESFLTSQKLNKIPLPTLNVSKINSAFTSYLSNFDLSNTQVEKIIAIGKIRQVKNNSVLVSHNSICDKAYFLLEGVFVCSYINEEKDLSKAVGFYIENVHRFFTCTDAFLFAQQTNYELRAIKKAIVIELSRDDIEDIVKDDIGLFRFYFQVVAKGLFEANELKSKMITESSENLFKYLTSEYPQLIKSVSSKYIAEFMGITPEWLSKIRKNQK
jgi:CRP-like cAMP-binding protein